MELGGRGWTGALSAHRFPVAHSWGDRQPHPRCCYARLLTGSSNDCFAADVPHVCPCSGWGHSRQRGCTFRTKSRRSITGSRRSLGILRKLGARWSPSLRVAARWSVTRPKGAAAHHVQLIPASKALEENILRPVGSVFEPFATECSSEILLVHITSRRPELRPRRRSGPTLSRARTPMGGGDGSKPESRSRGGARAQADRFGRAPFR